MAAVRAVFREGAIWLTRAKARRLPLDPGKTKLALGARDRLVPDTPDFSVPASRVRPLTEAQTESAPCPSPKTALPRSP